jgi:hypothetical protein
LRREDGQDERCGRLEDAKCYRSQAAALRVAAQQLSTQNRVVMLKIADDYDQMANTLEDIEETMRVVNGLKGAPPNDS